MKSSFERPQPPFNKRSLRESYPAQIFIEFCTIYTVGEFCSDQIEKSWDHSAALGLERRVGVETT